MLFIDFSEVGIIGVEFDKGKISSRKINIQTARDEKLEARKSRKAYNKMIAMLKKKSALVSFDE